MREKKMMSMIEREKYCLCCLPVELLQIILGCLSMMDLVYFRCVCKCWRAAFFKCPEPLPQSESHRRLPMFVLLKTDDSRGKTCDIVRPPLYTTGKLGDLSSGRIFTHDMPELCGTQFLLSKYGWLLLFSAESSSLFFLNPLSGTKINLPSLKDISNLESPPIFDISATPTSSDCIVFAIRHGVRPNWSGYEISTCRRGESGWTSKNFKCFGRSHTTRAVFVGGIWYCLHEEGAISVFDAVNWTWKGLILPKNHDYLCSTTPLSYVLKHGDEVHLNVHEGKGQEVVLKEPLEVIKTREEGIFWLADLEFMFRTSLKEAILKLQKHQVRVDSFNAHAWCVTTSDNNLMVFRWHCFRSFVDDWYSRKDTNKLLKTKRRCLKTNCCMVAWLEPESIHSSPNLDWASLG